MTNTLASKALFGLLLVSSTGLLFAMPWVFTSLNQLSLSEQSHPFYGLTLNTDAARFSLPSSNGQELDLQSLNDNYVYLMFGYTQCNDTCHIQTSNLLALSQRLTPMTDNVAFVFISLDPERDQPQQLEQYFTSLGSNFIALRPHTIREAQYLAAKYHEYASLNRVVNSDHKGNQDDYEIDHNGFIYLISPGNRLSLLYTPTQLNHLRMIEDFNQLNTQT